MKEQYKFIGIDEGKQTLLFGDTYKNKIHWIKSLENYPTARALQNLNNGTFLMGNDKGYCEVAFENGDILHDCSRWKGITSALRQQDGTTLLAGTNLEGMEGVSVITLDKNDAIIKAVSCDRDYVRLMSITDSGTYLLATNDHFRETDQELVTIKKLKAEGFYHAWQAQRLKDGRTLVSGGYGRFMAFFDNNGNLSKTFGRQQDVPEDVTVNFYASFRITDDGKILVANWQGHGPDNGNKSPQLLCFSFEGEYLKSWSFPNEISSLQGLLLV